MAKSYYQMCFDMSSSMKNLVETVEKNTPALRETYLAGKKYMKAVVFMCMPSASISFVKECVKNGYVNTVSSGVDGSVNGHIN